VKERSWSPLTTKK